MKKLLRRFLTCLLALYFTSQLLPALSISGGIKGYFFVTLAFMLADILLLPLIKILFLPLNLLTLGLFAWLTNVVALYILVSTLPTFKLLPYEFVGANLGAIIIPPITFDTFQVVIIASFLIGSTIHFISWLCK